MSPSNARGRRTREALLAATREILETEGPAGLTMRAVAERAGVTRRSVYLHFRSRQELVGSLFAYVGGHERPHTSSDRIRGCADARSAIREFADHVARQHGRLLAIDRAADHLDSGHDAPGLRGAVAAEQWQACRELADWLHRRGCLAGQWSPGDAADLLWALTTPQFLERWVPMRSRSGRRLAGQLFRVLNGVLLDRPTE